MVLQAPASPTPEQIPEPPSPRSTFQESLDLLFSKARTTKFPSPPSPDSPPEFNTPTDKRKKVEWSPWTDYQEHPARRNAAHLSSLTTLPPSGHRKPPRSILKSRNALISRDPNDSSTPPPPPAQLSFPIMLESVVRQLAGEDRTSRLDAYITFSGALKAWKNDPDPKALKDKMGLISQFIQRDLSAKTPEGATDALLASNALALLASLLYKESGTEVLSHDFCVFVMDYAINAFETGQASKEVMNRLLLVVGHQWFSARVMNTERIGKLITALHNIEKHVKGKSVVMGRLIAYTRLLQQGKPSMVANMTWFEDVLHEMFSQFTDIRSKAISLGVEAGLLLGTDGLASKAVQDILQDSNDEDKFGDFYARKLRALLGSKQDGGNAHVPQIWAVIILFLRHKRRQLEQWEFMKPWLIILQECLNSSDPEVRIQASRAWNRFVFAIRPDEKTTASMVNVLFNPVMGTLKPKGKLSPKWNATEHRNVAIGSLCNLLYYAFRPGSSFAQIDRYWDAYVVHLTSSLLKPADGTSQSLKDSQTTLLTNDVSLVYSILESFLDTTPKAWIENRANELGHLTPAEIPGLDPQWIRMNASRVLAVIEPLIQKSFADLSKPESPVSRLWNTFCEAIKVAGAKEIKVSNATMNAIAQICAMLYRVWNRYLQPATTPLLFRGFGCLVSSMISKLGVLPFTEKRLSLGLSNTFDVIITPSHRPKPVRGDVKCPLHHLVVLTSRVQYDPRNKDDYTEMIKTMLTPFLNARESRRTRFDFIQEINQLLPSQSLLGEHGNPSMWEVLAKFTEQVLEKSEESRSSGPDSEHQLGSEYRCVASILEAGLGTASESTFSAASSLFHAFIARVRAESGDGGVAIAVVEPLARGLLERRVPVPNKLSSSYCTLLLVNAQYPKDRYSLDAARRRLWGFVGGQRLSSVDPFSLLYGLVSCSLKSAYGGLSLEECQGLVLEASAIIERCPVQHLFHALDKLQEGLSFWIKDGDHKLTDQATATMLSSRINASIKKLPHINSPTLKKLSDLVSCGLESRHKFVANAAVETWNSTFGKEKSIDYPLKVMKALARLRPIADLKLPSFPDSLPSDFDASVPTFFESQDYEPASSVLVNSSPTVPHLNISRAGSSQASKKEAARLVVEVNNPTSRKRRFEGTPEPISRKQVKGHSTPKLRHDDSQVLFATIQSSPMSDAITDSQHLTDRQQEVKERQKTDAAALCRDFGSSPGTKRDNARSKTPINSVTPPLKAVLPTGRPRTPAVKTAAPAIFGDFITSSPTPSRGNADLPGSDAIDPPSSPPERIITNLPYSQPRRKSSVISQDYEETSWDITVGSEGVLQPKPVHPETELPGNGKAPQSADARSRSLKHTAGFNAPVDVPSTPVRTRVDQSPGSEVFMDALSSPAKFTPNKPKSMTNILDSSNKSSDPSPMPQETAEALQASQGSQGMARGIFNAAMNIPTNIKSFISPPKIKTPGNTMSSPLDEDSVLRVMNQFDRPPKGMPGGHSMSQPASTRHNDQQLEREHSPSASKKRRRSSFTVDENRQSLSEMDSQDSWKPSQSEEELHPPLNPLLNKALLPSTIPETPIRPGLAVEDHASTASKRPFTRSIKRLMTRSTTKNATEQAARDRRTQEHESSQVPESEIKVRAAAEPQADIDAPMRDFDHDSSLDFNHEEDSSAVDSGHFASTPKAKVQPFIEVKRSSISEPSGISADGSTTAGALLPIAEEAVQHEEEVELERDRGSSPSQQLLRDSDESSQRLLARESHSPSETAAVVSRPPMISVAEHLQAALAGLQNASLSREEVFDLEAVLLDVRRELFAAEERGRGRMSRSGSRSGN